MTGSAPARSFKAASPRKPVTRLDKRGRRLIDLMTAGFDTPEEAARWGLPAHEPLSLEQAAAPAGLRRGNARFLFTQPIFLKSFNENLAAYRNGSKALAIRTMVNVMNDQGENTAADRAVRLKASQAIMGDESRAGANVNVTLNQNTVNLTAGVVVRLPSSAATPPLERQPIEIAGEPIDARPIDADPSEEVELDPEAAPAMARAWPHTEQGE